MFYIVIIFLGLSLLAYALLGGADFGAGILEIFSGNVTKKTITHAIAPVWEANHMWLILMVVILFMGFPLIYSQMSLFLHIPLLALLLGIILRGTAFTFRHYDAIIDRSQVHYSIIFRFSSLITPFFLGVITGALILGRIDPVPASFYEGFIKPWFNGFCFMLGIFTCCLFAYLAAVYLIGEAENPGIQDRFVKYARNANLATVFSGGLVFVFAEWNGLPLTNMFLESAGAMIALILATISLPLLWWSLLKRKVVLPRILAGFQTMLILGAWFWDQYPVILRYNNGDYLSLLNAAAPEATLRQLALALVFGSVLIIPSLYFLMKTFKGNTFREET